MKSAARNVPQPFQVAAKSKSALFEVPATWKGCGTFSEESAEKTEITEQTERSLGCFPLFFRLFRYLRLFRALSSCFPYRVT
jgi:hypothetical protein